jgi:O-methyltransferase/methyltransferase family protein
MENTSEIGTIYMESAAAVLTKQTPTAAVLQLAAGFGISQAIFVAAKLGIPDFLLNGPKSVEVIAHEANLHAQALYRLLRALASVGIFAEDQHGVFRNTSSSETFMTSAPGSLRPFLIMSGEPECWRPWGELLHSVKTGRPAFEHVYGMPFFEYLTANSEPARIFDEAMASRSAAEIAAMLSVYDFSYAKRVVDIGGGNGALLAEVLRAFPQLDGVLYDLPSVVERAQVAIGSNDARARLRFQAGDFFWRYPRVVICMFSRRSSTTGQMIGPNKSCVAVGRPCRLHLVCC